MYDWNDDRVITQIPCHTNGKKKVALTFDDGPSEYLPEIARKLDQYQVKAVFFWLTSKLSHLVYDENKLFANHEIGLHGVDHMDMRILSKPEQAEMVLDGLSKLKHATNLPITWYRPPFGQYNSSLLEVLQANHLKPLLWEVASLDWENQETPERIVENVLRHIQDGSIILLHELPQTVMILDDLLKGIHDRGFEIVLPNSK